jgi:hypothetical protein
MEDDRVVSTWESEQLALAEADLAKRLKKTKARVPAPAALELTAQHGPRARQPSAESPHIVENSDGFRIWWPAKQLFVGRAGGGACATLVEAQGRLRDLLEIQTGKAKPVRHQLGMFEEPAPTAGPLFKLNPMGDHLGMPTPPRPRLSGGASTAAALGNYFPDDYQPMGPSSPRPAPIAPGRRSAKRNGDWLRDNAPPPPAPRSTDPVVRHRGEHAGEWRDAAEIAKDLRSDYAAAIKAKGLPPMKLSVTISKYAGGQSISVVVKTASFPVVNPDWVRAYALDPNARGGTAYRYTPRAQQVLARLEAMAQEYIRSETDSLSDYSNANVYVTVRYDQALEDGEKAALRAAKPNGRRASRGDRPARAAAQLTVTRFVVGPSAGPRRPSAGRR